MTLALLPRAQETANATVLASLTKTVIDYGVRRGIARERLLREARLDPAELEARDGRLARATDEAVWAVLERTFGSHGLGLAFAESRPGPRAYGVVMLRDMTADTFGAALRLHCRHHRVLKEDVGAQLVEARELATIYLTTPSGKLSCSVAMAEAAVAPYAIHARAWTGHDVDPIEVRFEHAAPRDASAYERTFRCPVHFEQPMTSIAFARSTLELPLSGAQHDVCEYLDHKAEEALAGVLTGDLLESVQRAIADGLDRDDVSAKAIAKRLGVSVRTLQRRLDEEQSSLRELVDRAREQKALAMLGDPEMPVAWISERLGFSDPRAFRRAFARWTGLSPDRYRRLRAS